MTLNAFKNNGEVLHRMFKGSQSKPHICRMSGVWVVLPIWGPNTNNMIQARYFADVQNKYIKKRK